MDKNLFWALPNVSHEEFVYLNKLTAEMNENQLRDFAMIYSNRRKDPRTIMIATLLGLFVVAGIQRFMLNQIGMGMLYLFTGGLCLIGTIMDLVNYNKLSFDFNKNQAYEIYEMMHKL